MVRILRSQWTNPIPTERVPINPYVYIAVPQPNIYIYESPGKEIRIPLHSHVVGNPPPAVRSVQGLPAWAMQDGTFITGTLPNDETETVSFEVETEN